MDAIDEVAQEMIALCASQGQSVVRASDRHHQEALRAELRRLARRWGLRVRTVATADRVAVARLDDQPWDDDEATTVRKLDGLIRGGDATSSDP